jgi:hypothetical protein
MPNLVKNSRLEQSAVANPMTYPNQNLPCAIIGCCIEYHQLSCMVWRLAYFHTNYYSPMGSYCRPKVTITRSIKCLLRRAGFVGDEMGLGKTGEETPWFLACLC